jgi:hypothetical protein
VWSPAAGGIISLFIALAVVAALWQNWPSAALLVWFASVTAAWVLNGCGRAKALYRRALARIGAKVL